MSPLSGKRFRTSEQIEDLAVTHRHAAGIDIHAAEHFVAVAAEDVPRGFVNPDAKLPAGIPGIWKRSGPGSRIAA